MKIVRGINFIEGSREEELPNFESNFPYIASRVELNQYAEDSIPWHWHKSVEVFYVEQGNLEYRTPNDIIFFHKAQEAWLILMFFIQRSHKKTIRYS